MTGVVLYVPAAAIHLHTGVVAFNLEAVANFLTVEPILIGHEDAFCRCFSGMARVGNNVLPTGGHVLDDPSNQFFLSPTCDAASEVQVNATAADHETATLDVTGQATTGKHVILATGAGTSCSHGTLR